MFKAAWDFLGTSRKLIPLPFGRHTGDVGGEELDYGCWFSRLNLFRFTIDNGSDVFKRTYFRLRSCVYGDLSP